MNEQLYLNDVLVDIKPKTIRQTKQFNTVEDMGSRQANYTNSFKLPYTLKNVKVLDALGVVGNVSRKPYQKIKAELKAGGFTLIKNGYAKVIDTDDDDGCEIVVYSGVYTIKELIGQGSIKTLDFSYLTTGNIELQGNASNLSKFCYPFGDFYNRITHNTEAPVLTLSILGYLSQTGRPIQPALYVKDIFMQIFNEAGLTVTGDILTDSGFSAEIINLNKPFPVSGLPTDIGEYLHEQKRWDFIKDVVNRYGLIIEPKDNDTVHFIKLENILSGANGVEDWSNKFNNSIKVSYEPESVGQLNTVELDTETKPFTQTEIEENDASIQASDVVNTYIDNFSFNEAIEIDNEHLNKTKELFKWNFVKPSYKVQLSSSASTSIGLNHLSFIPYYTAIEDGVGDLLNSFSHSEVERRLFKVYQSSYSVSYSSFSSSVTTNFYYDESQTDPNWYLNRYYPSYFKMMNSFHKVEANMNLNLYDVHKLDFTTLKFIRQLGGYFYLNKVKDWQDGKLTKVELVKVYPKITQTTTEINNQGLGSALEMLLG